MNNEQTTAITIGEAWVADTLRGYVSPVRRGRSKGTVIGFSREKQIAAHLIILFPTLRLKNIARLAGVSHGVFLVWRTQDNFRETEKKACQLFGEEIANTILNELGRATGTTYGPRPHLSLVAAVRRKDDVDLTDLIKILPFFNKAVFNHVSSIFSERLLDATLQIKNFISLFKPEYPKETSNDDTNKIGEIIKKLIFTSIGLCYERMRK